jgi:glutamate-ammonia-ligase adenylyltransferase
MTTALADLVSRAPLIVDAARAERYWADWRALSHASDAGGLSPKVEALLRGVFSASPFLTALALKRSDDVMTTLAMPPRDRIGDLIARLDKDLAPIQDRAEAMRALRLFKQDAALALALGDIGGAWPGVSVTEGITAVADAAVAAAVAWLFRAAVQRGEWGDGDPHPETRSGYTVIAMGKHGARELNYSSDIDLIIFYDPARACAVDGLELQPFFVRFTRDLVALLEARTADGYVFRTDLRLRPDAGATAVAMSRAAALEYYESFGQNWERAALIKARPVAGDLDTGAALLADLQPFVWRKYLDFAAIADIHAMKRQIHAVKGFGRVAVAGHDVKLGRGGIREIEFFAQTQQLIAGGRQPDLRTPRTLDALERLAARRWIEPAVAHDLTQAYIALRTVEHRLQMLDDEQTQRLPDTDAGLERLARFSGFETSATFVTHLTVILQTVEKHYAHLFEASPDLTAAAGGNMVFAGEADDPGTLKALADLGFSDPARVIALVRGWHHGRVRAIRTARARELLTEVQPRLIAAFARTADPDEAVLGFDRFLADLPSGVQLFSLLKQTPSLLDLIAAIMGTAPRLARILSTHRRVLDAVLDPGFFGAIADREIVRGLVAREVGEAADLQLALDRARVLGQEQAFLLGVRVLTGTIRADQAGGAYALLADQLIDGLATQTRRDMERQHGHVPGGAVAVIAMGKLGGREMTAASDLDLIVVYDVDANTEASDGPRPLSPSQWYIRFTQRLIAAFNAPTAEGALYEIDLRLRPSGQKGPVATQLSSFMAYQRQEAWSWEHMALTRARVVSGAPDLVAKVEAAIRETLTLPRERVKIAADVRDMRARIAAEKGTDDIWDLKQVRGGLVDLEFIAQFLQLVHAAAHPGVLDQTTATALGKLARAGCLAREEADRLIAACHLLHDLTQVLRLCVDGRFDAAAAPDGLKLLLARVGGMPDMASLEAHLRATLDEVHAAFERLVV